MSTKKELVAIPSIREESTLQLVSCMLQVARFLSLMGTVALTLFCCLEAGLLSCHELWSRLTFLF
jgi:hypothetical protein